ncbi:hypothetical protein NQ318_020199 [Aromia moschata]|uniref:MYND-type domain-containing protein n=1 Tax=Aromia moschata TaxID=1265417 RepID=A0AAV8ZC49_9CUCU|nr:hypothetical protein NQ318_020199 [Aromia moschata]
MDYSHARYNKFFYSNLCHVCKAAGEYVKRCSLCKSIAYCSKDHQVLDWELHKHLCKIIAKNDKALLRQCMQNFQDFKAVKVMKSVLWKNCPDCLNVSYCSEEHKNEFAVKHSQYCDALKLCMDVDLYYFNENYTPTDVEVKVFDDTIKALPNNLEELMSLYDKDSRGCSLDDKIQFIIKSDYIAPAATLLYGMETSGLVQNRLFSREALTVHIVGADITETAWLWELITELLFHWIRNVNTLDYHVVGPELFYDGIEEELTAQLCDHCKIRKPRTAVTFHSGLYHEIEETLSKPDVVVAFNSGLHEYYNNSTDSWKDSINSLTKYPDVPLVLTAYTLDEIKQDVDIVRVNSEHKVRTILEPERNRFSNTRPIRDWENENVPVFYIHNWNM